MARVQDEPEIARLIAANQRPAIDHLREMRCRDGLVLLQVRNDGAPAGRSSGGFGLTGMAERAASLGGRFHAGPLPTGGWRVAAELPVNS